MKRILEFNSQIHIAAVIPFVMSSFDIEGGNEEGKKLKVLVVMHWLLSNSTATDYSRIGEFIDLGNRIVVALPFTMGGVGSRTASIQNFIRHTTPSHIHPLNNGSINHTCKSLTVPACLLK